MLPIDSHNNEEYDEPGMPPVASGQFKRQSTFEGGAPNMQIS